MKRDFRDFLRDIIGHAKNARKITKSADKLAEIVEKFLPELEETAEQILKEQNHTFEQEE
jgi:uncharacterized protein with HEPN domain